MSISDINLLNNALYKKQIYKTENEKKDSEKVPDNSSVEASGIMANRAVDNSENMIGSMILSSQNQALMNVNINQDELKKLRSQVQA